MIHDFCDHCPGCRPALIDLKTGKLMAQDSATMKAVNDIWNKQTTYDERKAFIAVTAHNSRKAEDVLLAQSVMTKIMAATRDEKG